MAKNKKIIRRIETVTLTQKITQTMKLMATSFLERTKERRKRIFAYQKSLEDLMQTLVEVLKDFPLPKPPVNSRHLLVAITSDKGLAGGFTSQMGKAIGHYYQKLKEKNKEVVLLPIGKKGIRQCQKEELPFLNHFPSIESEGIENALVDFLSQAVFEKKYQKISLLYQPRSVGTALSTFCLRPLFPLPFPKKRETIEKADDFSFLLESKPEEILSLFLRLFLRSQVLFVFHASRYAEQRARMMNMHQANENAKSLLKTIKTNYNRSRQAAITQEINEINGTLFPQHR